MRSILLLIIFLGCLPAFAEDQHKIGIFSYSIDNSDGCTITLQPVSEKAKSFPLENPNRFVIDVPIQHGGKNQTVSIKNPCIESIRLGVHPDYSRIVIDLQNKVLLEKFSIEKNIFTMIFKSTDSAGSPLAPTSAPTLSPTIKVLTPTPTQTPTSTSTPLTKDTLPAPTIAPKITISPSPVSNTPTATRTTATTPLVVAPEVTSTRAATPTLQPVLTTASPTVEVIPTTGGEITLTGINFKTSPEQVLELNFSAGTQFSLLRINPTLFKVLISNAQFGNDQVKHTFFAPQDFNGITAVLPKIDVDDLYLEIVTDVSAKLFAYREGTSILIRVEK